MSAFMNLQIFTACEQFATVRMQALERLLSGVDANVVDELVLRLERPQVSIALLPQALVVGRVGSANVLGVYVLHNALHRIKAFHAGSAHLIRVEPEAGQVALDRRLVCDRIGRTVAAQRVRRQRMVVQNAQLVRLASGVRR